MQVRRKITYALAVGITFVVLGAVLPAGGMTRALAAAAHPATAAHPVTARRAAAAHRAGPAAVRPVRLKRVAFAGYTLDVPAAWPVYRLDRDPGRCVRYDQHAVYLGRPGADQQCPAHLVGRTATITVQAGPAGGPPSAGPAIAALPAGRGTVTAGRSGNVVQATLAGSGLSITGTYGGSPAPVLSIIRSVRPARAAAGGQAMAPARAARHRPAPHHPRSHRARRHRARTHHGRTHHGRTRHGQQRRSGARRHRTGRMEPARPLHGFDSCSAPSLPAMRAFRRSFAVAAIYIGGPEQGCAQPNLTAAWVRKVTRLGYALMPTYVGPQASCSPFSVRIVPRRAARQGRAAALHAIASARALGMGRGTPLYYDLEDYNGANTRCRTSSLAFLNAWTRALHARGYLSGVYSSVTPGVATVGAAIWMSRHPVAKPDAVWFGLWDARRNLFGTPWLLAAWWSGPHRTKQYLGPHRRTLGGHTVDIDSDWVYGAVYR